MTRLKETREEIQPLTKIKKELQREVIYPNISDLKIEKDKLIANFVDGRETSIPREWLKKPNFFNLNSATTQQLQHYEILADRKTIYWPEIDEFLHVRTFIDGLEARCCW